MNQNQLPPSAWWVRMAVFLFRLSVVIAAALFIFGLYLDAKITQRFEGDKWQLPSLVYSRALTLYPHSRLNQAQLLHELELLKYERTPHPPSRPGEYQLDGHHVFILRRAFDFPDGREGVKPLHLRFDDQHLIALQDPASGRDLTHVRLDPVLLERLHLEQREDRILVRLDNVPELLVKALVTVEDQEFFSHAGISFTGILRALMVNLRSGRTVQGGSTITQQLAKNFFLTRERRMWRKIQELYMAFIIDLRYSKEEILEAYLNEVYLGQNFANGVHGIGLASYFYFGRPMGELDVHQIALLAALIKGPSYYDPWRHPLRAKSRRDLVLRLVFEAGWLQVRQYQHALAQPLDIIARGKQTLGRTPAFMGWLKKELIDKLGESAARQSGLKIFTSLDPIAQRAAEQAARETLDQLDANPQQTPLETAMVISNWRSSELIALVGGRKPEFAGFNRAMDASLQVGSLAKPAVYLTALAKDYQLATPLLDEPITLKNEAGQEWSPRNHDHQFRGQVPLIVALMRSINVPTVNLGMAVGLPEVMQTLRKLGVHTPLNPFPSLLLGAFNLTPIQANQMYLTLANQGTYQPLSAIRAIFKSGVSTPIYRAEPQPQRVLDPLASWLTLYALTQVVENGSARRLKQSFPDVQLAAKTGTTNASRSTWFSGMDNEELVTVWVGKDDHSPSQLYGSSGPLRVYQDYLKRRGVESLQLFVPDGISWGYFSPHTGAQVRSNCADSLHLPTRSDQLSALNDCDPPTEKNWFQRLFQ